MWSSASNIAMFFPDKSKAFSEARRVLRAVEKRTHLQCLGRGSDQNEFAETATVALQEMFPADPASLHGSCSAWVQRHRGDRQALDRRRIRLLGPRSSSADSRAPRRIAPSIPAIAYCQGTLLRSEIENSNPRGWLRPRMPRRRRSASGSATAPSRARFKPLSSSRSDSCRRVRPNPSLKRSANGRPPGPVWRYAVHFRQPGPGVLPSSPA